MSDRRSRPGACTAAPTVFSLKGITELDLVEGDYPIVGRGHTPMSGPSATANFSKLDNTCRDTIAGSASRPRRARFT